MPFREQIDGYEPTTDKLCAAAPCVLQYICRVYTLYVMICSQLVLGNDRPSAQSHTCLARCMTVIEIPATIAIGPTHRDTTVRINKVDRLKTRANASLTLSLLYRPHCVSCLSVCPYTL